MLKSLARGGGEDYYLLKVMQEGESEYPVGFIDFFFLPQI